MIEQVLRVFLNKKPVGTLNLLAGDQTLFAFDEDYIRNKERAILSLSFKSALGELNTDLKPTRARLPPFFSNLLPEGPLRTYLAKRAGVKEEREFFLLQTLGKDLPGAVTIEPFDVQGMPSRNKRDNKEIKRVQEGLLRFSLAGIQLKFSAIDTLPGGLTIPVTGDGGDWIIKLPSTTFQDVPENEFAMMGLARLLGMNVPEVKLVALGDISGLPKDIGKIQGNAFVIKRFDRIEKGGLIHVEDFAQIFGVYPEKKYDKANYRNIAEVIRVECEEEDIVEFVRRLIFNTLIGNGDMHLKNWSLIYPDGRKTKLAPAYDFLSTIPYIKDTRTALNLVKTKQMTDWSLEQLSYFAAKAKLPEKLVLDTVRETVEGFKGTWKNGEYLSGLNYIRDEINNHLQKIKLFKEL